MIKTLRIISHSILLLFLVFVSGKVLAQTNLYTEGTDLSNSCCGSTFNISSAGTYTVVGTLATTADGADWFQISIGSGLQLDNVQYSFSGPGSFDGGVNFAGLGSASVLGTGSGSVSISPFSYPLSSGTYFTQVFANFSVGNGWTMTYTVSSACTSPAITGNPTNSTQCAGGTATFTASASGSPSPTVQWQVSTDGGATFNDISGATSTTLSFATVAGDNGNQYQAVFTNGCGSATSAAATLTVNTSPTISANPSDQSICSGSTVNFTAAPNGTPSPTVQWQVSTDGGATFNNIGGATSTTLSFTTSTAQNGNMYRAVFTNTCGNANTTGATLNVYSPITITTNPVSQTICQNTTVTYTAAATGSSSVQWQVSFDGGSTWTNFTGQTTTTLSFVAGLSEAGREYRAVFSNPCGSVATNAANIFINTPPAITKDPSTQSICTGNTVTFTAAASGTPVPSVQWYQSTDLGTTYNLLAGATSPTLSFTTSAAQDGYRYRATFTNTCGFITSNYAILNVYTAPGITTNPSNQTICTGGTATFSVAGTGTPAPAVQWQLSTDGGATWTNVGLGGNTYSIVAGLGQNGWQYRAIFTNTCGSITTSAASLTVNSPATVATNPSNQTVCAGNSVTFVSAGAGTPAPTAQWQTSTDGGVTWNNISGATSASLSFIAAASNNNNVYRVIYTNSCGTTASSPAFLTVNNAPSVSFNPVSQTICSGNYVTFGTGASGTPNPTVQWQQSTDGGVTWNNIPGATSTTLGFTTSSSQNGYQYRAVFTNTCGTVNSSAATLNVNSAPTIITNPSSVTVCPGNTVSFTVAANGLPIPAIQWQLSTNNGGSWTNVGLGGNTYSVFVGSGQNGWLYRAVVSNSCGSITSSIASVTVNSAPVVTTNPASQSICVGNTVTFTAAASGSPAPAVQWQQSTDGGLTFTDILGATSTSYSFATSAAQNTYRYRAQFKNSCGVVVSGQAILTVNIPPVIVSSPVSQTVCPNTSVSFYSAATGSPLPTPQWQLSIDGGTTWTNVGAPPSTTYTIMAGLGQNGWKYRAVFTNACGTATSPVATLTVNTPPSITSQPSSVQSCEGTSVSISVVGAGTGVAYDWFYSTDYGATYVNTGVFTPTITINPLPRSWNGRIYRCTVSGTCPTPVVSSLAKLTVDSFPVIYSQPTSVELCSGQPTSFQITATGSNITYTWQVNTGSGFTNLTATAPYSGVNTNKLQLSATTDAMSGYQYRCVVTGTCAPAATSNIATLKIDTLPLIVNNPIADTVCNGDPASFTVNAVGTGLTYQWQVYTGIGSFTNLVNGSPYTGTNTATLGLPYTRLNMNGYYYRCIITGKCAPIVTTTPALLTIHTPPAIVYQTQDPVICNTATDSFSVIATGNYLNYQWQVSLDNGNTWNNIPNSPPYSNVTTSTLVLSNVTNTMNKNQYRVIITGQCPPADTSAVIILTVTNNTTWTGAVNNKWSNIHNWSCGVLPVATTEVHIPYNAPNWPTVDIPGAICDSIYFDNTTQLSFTGSSNTLEVKGSMICKQCKFDASAGSVIFSGSKDQIILNSTYKNLEISGTGNKFLKGGDATVTGNMNLLAGMLVLGDNTVTLGSDAKLLGGSNTAEIITNGTGVLKMKNIGTGGNSATQTIPLSSGIGATYTPLDFTNTGTPQTYSIAVYDNINTAYDKGFAPAGSAISTNAVGKSWRLSSDSGTGSNVSLTLHWNGSDELPGFNRQACYISVFSIPNWQPAADIESCTGSDPYMLTKEGFNYMSVFAVTSAVHDSTFIARNGSVLLYPNPASTILNVKFKGTPGRKVNIYILNDLGKEVYRVAVDPYTYEDGVVPVDVTNLYPGEYQVIVEDVNDNSEVRTSRFIKP
jgi:hypothetical protein